MLQEGLQSASIVRHKRPDHRQASQGYSAKVLVGLGQVGRLACQAA